jgi:hypothetical protein
MAWKKVKGSPPREITAGTSSAAVIGGRMVQNAPRTP